MMCQDADAMEDEIGDMLFVLVNLARKCGTTGDAALRRANAKFESRVRHMEKMAAQENTSLAEESLEKLEARWVAAKQAKNHH
jgi:ATP diphosphatase